MEYDHNLSLKENYMRFYQDCSSMIGINYKAAHLVCTAYIELSPDDELEKQRIYLRDNGIKHCKWVLAQWDPVFMHWKETGSIDLASVLNDSQHKTQYMGWDESFVKDDENPLVIGYELNPETHQLYKHVINIVPTFIDDNGDIIEPEDETDPQPTQPSVTEATQPVQPPQPETQQSENTPEEPTRLPIDMCDELREYIEAKAPNAVFNKGPKNPLYNINLARELKDNVFTGNDPISDFDRVRTCVY